MRNELRNCEPAVHHAQPLVQDNVVSVGEAQASIVLGVIRRERRTSLSAKEVAGMPANERLCRTHPGAGMLTVADPSRHSRHAAAVTDGGGGADMRPAISAQLRGRPSFGVCLLGAADLGVLAPGRHVGSLGVGLPDSRGWAWTVAVFQARPGTARVGGASSGGGGSPAWLRRFHLARP